MTTVLPLRTCTGVDEVTLPPSLTMSEKEVGVIRSFGEIVKKSLPAPASAAATPTMMSRAPSPVTSKTCAEVIGPRRRIAEDAAADLARGREVDEAAAIRLEPRRSSLGLRP